MIADIDAEVAHEAAMLAHRAGGRVLAIAADVAEFEQVDAMVTATIGLFGRVDMLMNNAAICHGIRCAPAADLRVDEWDRVFAVNVRGRGTSSTRSFRT